MVLSASVLGKAAVSGGDVDLRAAIAEALAREGFGEAAEARTAALVHIASEPRLSVTGSSAKAMSEGLGGALRQAFLDLQSGVAAIREGGGGGSIVFVAPASSERAHGPLRQGLRLLAKAAALELGPEDIRVNLVLPGAGDNPLGRACGPADVASSVAFAAGLRSRFMTGAEIIVDGGRMAS